MRRGEIFALDGSDADIGWPMITVRGDNAKTSQSREISVNPPLLDALRKWPFV